MKRDDKTQDPGAIQRENARVARLTRLGADPEDARRQTRARVAARQRDATANAAGMDRPAGAEPTPLVTLFPPGESVEEHPAQGHEQIFGRHGQPVKKRDLRKRPNRKRPKYVSTGRPIGNPAFEPTDEQRKMVTVMVGMLVPRKTIASLIGPDGISENTMNKHFKRELENGSQHFLATIKALIVKSAQNGSVRAQTYLLDRLGGPEFSPRIGGADQLANVPIQINETARVSIFLPDNHRDSAPPQIEGRASKL